MEIDFNGLELQHIEAALETRCFDTGDAERNKAMKDYFSLETHSESSFVMTGCREFCRLDDDHYRLIVPGVLESAGIRR